MSFFDLPAGELRILTCDEATQRCTKPIKVDAVGHTDTTDYGAGAFPEFRQLPGMPGPALVYFTEEGAGATERGVLKLMTCDDARCSNATVAELSRGAKGYGRDCSLSMSGGGHLLFGEFPCSAVVGPCSGPSCACNSCSASCLDGLRAACHLLFGNGKSCLTCTGTHQSKLRAAGCSHLNLEDYCAAPPPPPPPPSNTCWHTNTCSCSQCTCGKAGQCQNAGTAYCDCFGYCSKCH